MDEIHVWEYPTLADRENNRNGSLIGVAKNRAQFEQLIDRVKRGSCLDYFLNGIEHVYMERAQHLLGFYRPRYSENEDM